MDSLACRSESVARLFYFLSVTRKEGRFQNGKDEKSRNHSGIGSGLLLRGGFVGTGQRVEPWIPCWAKKNLTNSQKAVSIPIWQRTRDGSAESVEWMDHASNPRFAIYDYNEDNNPADESTLGDDLVLDKETGLIWPRDAGIGPSSNDQLWWRGSMWCFRDFELGNRKGWRLPAIEELATLIGPSKESPGLPTGHPFINVKEGSYWSSTTATTYPEYALCVDFILGNVSYSEKENFYYLRPVRGGFGLYLSP